MTDQNYLAEIPEEGQQINLVVNSNNRKITFNVGVRTVSADGTCFVRLSDVQDSSAVHYLIHFPVHMDWRYITSNSGDSVSIKR